MNIHYLLPFGKSYRLHQRILLAGVTAVCASMATSLLQAQEQPPSVEYTLRVTSAEVDTIGRALSQRPYAEVAGVLGKMANQINEQNAKRSEGTQVPLPKSDPRKE